MNIYIVGKDARFQLLRELTQRSTLPQQLTNTFCRSHTVVLNNRQMPLQQEHHVMIVSHDVPLHTTIWFPCDDSISLDGKILLVDEFPVGDSLTQKNMEQLRDQYPELPLEILLFYNNRQGLHTDISTEQEAICQVQKQLQAQHIPVYVYGEGQDKPFLYWGIQNFLEIAKTTTRRALETIRQEVLFCFDMERELGISGMEQANLFDPDALEWLTRYSRQADHKDIAALFAEQGQQLCFYTKHTYAIKPLLRQYEDLMTTVMVWDKALDLQILENSLKQRYRQRCAALPKAVFHGETPQEYLLFLNETHIDIAFKQLVEKFLKEDVWEVLKAHIEKRIQQVEEMII